MIHSPVGDHSGTALNPKTGLEFASSGAVRIDDLQRREFLVNDLASIGRPIGHPTRHVD